MVNKAKMKKVMNTFLPKRAVIAKVGSEPLEIPNFNKGKAPESDKDLANKKYVDDNAGSDGSDHDIADHDTTATGAELDTLTDNSMADTLHRHSELSASDGTPDACLSLDASGRMTNTSQPCFSEKLSANQENIALNSYVKVAWDTEIFDVGNNFADGVFTAPVTGKYQLNFNTCLLSMDTAADAYIIRIYTSNRGYSFITDPAAFTADTDFGFSISVLADMDANDTVEAQIYQAGGTQQTDIYSVDYSCFSGVLIC